MKRSEGKFGASFDRLGQTRCNRSLLAGGSTGKIDGTFSRTGQKSSNETVVVSQSWSEIHKVNEQVRLGLKTQKLIGETETSVTALERMDLTDAQNATNGFICRIRFSCSTATLAVSRRASAGNCAASPTNICWLKSDSRIRRVPFKIWKNHGLPAERTFLVHWRPAATQSQWLNARTGANSPTANWSR
jgi:hypothetical protein